MKKKPPLTDVLPSFALSNPEVTQKMTFQHTLCMCSSVPEHKEAITVQYSEMTTEGVIETRRQFRFLEHLNAHLTIPLPWWRLGAILLRWQMVENMMI